MRKITKVTQCYEGVSWCLKMKFSLGAKTHSKFVFVLFYVLNLATEMITIAIGRASVSEHQLSIQYSTHNCMMGNPSTHTKGVGEEVCDR
jgi:hypothetical protein